MKPMNGKIVQVIGPVVDVEFSEELPAILTALETKAVDGHRVVLEVQAHVGGNRVRTVSMQTTDSLRRGLEVTSTGAPISWTACTRPSSGIPSNMEQNAE